MSAKLLSDLRARGDDAWKVRHNRCLLDFGQPPAHASADERFILSLAAVIDTWAELHPEDGYGKAEVFIPMVQAFRAALNFNLDRLDAGTLSRWAERILERLHVDPDTYDRLP